MISQVSAGQEKSLFLYEIVQESLRMCLSWEGFMTQNSKLGSFNLPRPLLLIVLLLLMLLVGAGSSAKSEPVSAPSINVAQQAVTNSIFFPYIARPATYVLLGWNDLGMHCYNHDFQDLAVLPPYNNLWAQVVMRGDPPQIITQGIRVQYSFPENTTSSNKSDFWTYAPKLFGISLPDNVGLKGKGLAGVMDAQADYFVAEGIPLTEFNDSAPTTPYPYQKASLIAKNAETGEILTSLTVVAPVSTEMHCDTCHATGSGRDPGGNLARTELNILARHDGEEGTQLLNQRPVLCARCHSSNALGAPGVSGVPSLSHAMHSKHAERVPNSLDGCYACHPGPATKCLRDAMSLNVNSTLDPSRKFNCIDCHGGMSTVAQNPNPWLNEPRCDTCHTQTATRQYNQDNALYRHSKGHGGIYCEACHDSTHAIAASGEPNDAIKFVQLQGRNGTLSKCTVCHLTQPTGPGPHVR